jgi:hypothetical protein
MSSEFIENYGSELKNLCNHSTYNSSIGKTHKQMLVYSYSKSNSSTMKQIQIPLRRGNNPILNFDSNELPK